MPNQTPTPANASSRRHFLLSASLATAALGLKAPTGMGAPAWESRVRADASGKLCLWSDRPAATWMTEALPIGNGPMGAKFLRREDYAAVYALGSGTYQCQTMLSNIK
jgi:alpha-L-fucosidase 2